MSRYGTASVESALLSQGCDIRSDGGIYGESESMLVVQIGVDMYLIRFTYAGKTGYK